MTSNQDVANVADIPDDDGRTPRQKNRERHHKYRVNQLVHVRRDEWHGSGASQRIEANLYIVELGRDCDETPLYWLSPTPRKNWDKIIVQFPDDGIQAKPDTSQRIFYGCWGGFEEEALTPICAAAILDGKGALKWGDQDRIVPAFYITLGDSGRDYHITTFRPRRSPASPDNTRSWFYVSHDQPFSSFCQPISEDRAKSLGADNLAPWTCRNLTTGEEFRYEDAEPVV